MCNYNTVDSIGYRILYALEHGNKFSLNALASYNKSKNQNLIR